MTTNDAVTGQAIGDIHLVVIHPFGEYAKGQHISDTPEIAAVLAGENAGSCNKISVVA